MARLGPHSYADLDQGRVARLALEWEVDFVDHRLRGEATLKLAEPAEGPLDLDTRDLDIEAVTTQDRAPLPWRLSEPEGFMGARLTVERPTRTSTLRIRYATSPGASALQWLAAEHTAGREHPFLFSQCQPIHARSMVPLQDTARARFSFTAKVTVPRPLAAVMGAAPGVPRPGPDEGHQTYTFSMPQPIPSYLLAIAVGNIVSRDLGPRSRVYAEPETLEAAAYEFAEVDTMLRAAEELFGPYLWERFDFLVMPPAFPYGGMENPRLTFLTPTLLAGDRSLVNVLAHELAHSWTGNLVTNATMNDFWLNEGFTVWAERRILERLSGREAVSLAAAVARHELDQAIVRFGAGSPLTRLETDMKGMDPDEVYSEIPYEKGCLFVTLLERSAGSEAFDRFLRRYIERFRFSSITTAQFEEFLEAELPGLRRQVQADLWLHGPGIPDNCPRFHSNMLQEIEELAAGWAEGRRPDPDAIARWSVDQWRIYLQRLKRPMSHEDCLWLESSFDLNESRNAEILCEWLSITAASAFEPSFERIRAFLGSVGRMKFLKPLYTALKDGETTRELACSTFEQFKDNYHPIARVVLEQVLSFKEK